MSVLKNPIATSGRTVIATIHQPASQIFDTFDTLLLMHKGGREQPSLPAATQCAPSLRLQRNPALRCSAPFVPALPPDLLFGP
eukprot:6179144-Pleurochrysis_carterae.AAC.2